MIIGRREQTAKSRLPIIMRSVARIKVSFCYVWWSVMLSTDCNLLSISSERLLSSVNVDMESSSLRNTVVPNTEGRYIPRGRNELHKIFDNHFADFCKQYDEKYAAKYGMFRRDRIQQVGENFSTCGDYLQGVVRIHGYAMFPALVRK